MEINRPPGLCLDPATKDATAGKNQGVHGAAVDDGQFQVTVERSGRGWLPHNAFLSCPHRLAH
jgi:hypothetical protein